MIPGDPNVLLVERVVAALGELREELVLVGGCAASLLIEAPTAAPARVTYDVDLLAEVVALKEYHVLEHRLAARGFARDASTEAPVCRWTLGAVKVDLMPVDESVLGTRGRGDVMVSHDFEDIVNVVEGRPRIVAEIESAQPDLRQYLIESLSAIVAGQDLANALPGLVIQDELHAQRVMMVRERFAAISRLQVDSRHRE